MDHGTETQTSVSDLILEKLNIFATGACLPPRFQPLDCYAPQHLAYVPRDEIPAIDSVMQAACPGAIPRKIENETGVAWVYDQDITTTWRLPDVARAYEAFEVALARGTVWCAIEHFVDTTDTSPCATVTLLQRFRDYVRALETQTVTITISSLVEDMLEAYCLNAAGLAPFSCAADLPRFIEGFVRTRDCFHHADGRPPWVVASFVGCEFAFQTAELDVQLHFGWAPPVIHFQELRNSVFEGETFTLKPLALEFQHPDAGPPQLAEFRVGPTETWLRWNATMRHLAGTIPQQRAWDEGALRLDAYTIPVHVMARISTTLPGDVVLERIIRCALPLTVKRRPDRCGLDAEPLLSPPLRATASQPLMDLGRNGRAAMPARGDKAAVVGEGLGRVTPGNAALVSSARSEARRAYSANHENKENATDFKEVVNSLRRKAEQSTTRQSPPLRINSLSLARLYDDVQPFYLDQQATTSRAVVQWASNNSYRVHMAHETMGDDGRLAGDQESEELPSFQSDL